MKGGVASGVLASAVLLFACACGVTNPTGPGLRIRTPDGIMLTGSLLTIKEINLFARDLKTRAIRHIDTYDWAQAARIYENYAYEGEELVLWVPGCKDLVLTEDPQPDVLELDYGWPIHLRLAGTFDLPPGYGLMAQLQWRGAGDQPDALFRHQYPQASRQEWFRDAARSVFDLGIPLTDKLHRGHAVVATPAAYRVHFVVRYQRPHLSHPSSTPFGTEHGLVTLRAPTTMIEVLDTPEEQTFELSLDKSVLARCIKRIQTHETR